MKTKFWKHQAQAFDFAREKPAAMLAMEMGTGKTLVAVALAEHWRVQRVLVVCPKTVINVWPREFNKHCPNVFKVVPLTTGTVAAKAKEARRWLEFCSSPVVIVINYESAYRDDFAEWAARAGFDLLVMDESHKIKKPGGKASWFCYNISKKVKHKLALTGTPMPHSPLDIYAQFRALNPAIFKTNYSLFKKRYAVLGGYGDHQVIGWQNTDDLNERFYKLAYQVKKKDALDLPTETSIDIPVKLSPKAMKEYKQLEKDFYLWVEELGEEVTVANAMVKLLRLQQITSGYVHSDDGVEIKMDTAKQEALMELIEDADQPMVVFCRFRHDLKAVRETARALGKQYGEISGAQKDLTDEATMPEGIDVMGVQIQSGGVGIDLTRASIGVYYSMGFSLGDYDQSLNRIHRPGQTRKVTYYHIVAEQTVDEKVYKALQKRKDVIQTILEVARDGKRKTKQ